MFGYELLKEPVTKHPRRTTYYTKYVYPTLGRGRSSQQPRRNQTNYVCIQNQNKFDKNTYKIDRTVETQLQLPRSAFYIHIYMGIYSICIWYRRVKKGRSLAKCMYVHCA